MAVQVTMPGIAHVTFHRTGERFSYKRIKMLIHNVIWGKLWIEVYDGDMRFRAWYLQIQRIVKAYGVQLNLRLQAF